MDSRAESLGFSEAEAEDDDALSSHSSSAPLAPFTIHNPRPDLPPALPALVLRKLVAAELLGVGFKEADQEALEEIEGALYEFFGSLLTYAHQLAELGRRHVPTVADVVKGCEDLGVGGTRELLAEARRGRPAVAEDVQIAYKGPRAFVDLGPLLPSDDEDDDPHDPSKDPSLASPPPSPPLPPFSDDEDSDAEFEEVGPAGGSEAEVKARKEEAAEAQKRAKREKRDELLREKEARRTERERRRRERQRRREANPMKAEWLPALPPKHSWKQTPVYPESAAPPPIPPPISQAQQAPSAAALQHLSTLRARLNDSQLVAASLRNLIRRTAARSLNAGKDGNAPTAPNGAPMDVENQPQQQQQQQQEADVVNYESEWYGAKDTASAVGANTKRRIRVLMIGKGQDDFDEDDERERAGRKGQNGDWNDASRVGAAAKRRRWLV
ncbi:bromodomain transcription factor [Rhodotorula toruloides]|uniref:Bromodomain transcription factor n=1 Tax=Rhodotorula toruloides TaxID=5286 RepID=A0A511KM88_RHOTO|nr:bromodomain transcription factor [Rhodotorula toruloides]